MNTPGGLLGLPDDPGPDWVGSDTMPDLVKPLPDPFGCELWGCGCLVLCLLLIAALAILGVVHLLGWWIGQL